METLSILNLIINFFVIFYLMYDRLLYRIKFEWKKSFWMKKKYGVTLWWYNRGLDCGKSVMNFNFIDRKKIDKMDEDFYSSTHQRKIK